MFRPTFALVLCAATAACVPSEDQSATADAQAQPARAVTPNAAPRPLNNPRQPRVPIASANPFQHDGAPSADTMDAALRAVHRADGGAPTAALPASGTPMRAPPVALRPQPVVPAAAAAPAAPAAAPDAPITAVYYDAFDRPELGPEWNPTSPEWRVQGGRLCGRNAHNHPVWHKRKLPANARIEFDATSVSPDGDLKVEIWGDGKSFAKGTSYNDATSYLAIFGGWKNQFHVLARLDEHAPGRPEVKINPAGTDVKARAVRPNTSYHFKVERSDGKTVRWLVDDIEIISFTDKEPLKGDGHDHLGFNDWEAMVCFDNLQITALPGG